MTVNNPVDLFTDGACKGNPGPGGLAYIIRTEEVLDNEELKENTYEYAEGYRKTTNNRMELLAVIKGLEKVAETAQTDKSWEFVNQVNLYTDSEYVANALNKGWLVAWQKNNWVTSTQSTVKNRDLWERMINAQALLQAVNLALVVSWIKGHADTKYNNKCDELAVRASEAEEKLVDEVYESKKE